VRMSAAERRSLAVLRDIDIANKRPQYLFNRPAYLDPRFRDITDAGNLCFVLYHDYLKCSLKRVENYAPCLLQRQYAREWCVQSEVEGYESQRKKHRVLVPYFKNYEGDDEE